MVNLGDSVGMFKIRTYLKKTNFFYRGNCAPTVNISCPENQCWLPLPLGDQEMTIVSERTLEARLDKKAFKKIEF